MLQRTNGNTVEIKVNPLTSFFTQISVYAFLKFYFKNCAAMKFVVSSFSTRLLSSCTAEYAHTYDISTY